MATTCDLIYVHPVTGGAPQTISKLNKDLLESYPKDVEADPKKAGVSSQYIKVRTDPKFLKWFGNWTDPDIHAELVKQAKNTAVFDEYGEPRLHVDITGNKYFLSVHKKKFYIKALYDVVSSTEINDVINTLSGEFIKSKKQNLPVYIEQKIESIISDTQATITKMNEITSSMQANFMAEPNMDTKRVILEQHKIAVTNLSRAVHKLNKLKSLNQNADLLRVVKNRISNRLQRFNFKYDEDVEDKDDPDKYNDVANFIMDSNETSNRAINDPVILSFLSSIPMFHYNKNKDAWEESKNILLGTTMYQNQNNIWGLLEEQFSGILPDHQNSTQFNQSKNVFDNYLTALELLANKSADPGIQYIYDYLSNLDKNVDDPVTFKTKLVSAFFKANQHYIITQVSQKKEVDPVTGVETGKYVNVFNVINPGDKNSKVAKLSNEYMETIMNNFNDKSQYVRVRTKYIKKFYDIKNSNNPDLYYAFLNELLNDTFGLNISHDILQYLIKMNTDPFIKDDLGPLKGMIHKLLEEPIKGKNYPEFTEESPVNGELSLLSELKYPRNKRNLSEKSDRYKKKLLQNDGFFKSLAAASKLFTKDVSESSYMVGGSQRWAYSYMSGLDIEVGRWKKGLMRSLERIKHRGLQFVEYMLNPKTNLSDLTVTTNSEIKKERDNTPALHKKITEVDYQLDNYAKMNASRNESFLENVKMSRKEGSKLERERQKIKNYIMYNFGADKNSLFAIFGLPNLTHQKQMYDATKKELGVHFKQVLNDYLHGELKEAEYAGMVVDGYFKQKTDADKRKYLMNNLIPGYHYVIDNNKKTGLPAKDITTENLTKEDFEKGSYYKIGIFTSSLNEYTGTGVNNNLIYIESETKPKRINPEFINKKGSNFNKLASIIHKDVNDIIKDNYKYLNDIILIKKEVDGTKIEVKMTDVQSNSQSGTSEESFYNYIVASFLNNYELSNIFNGHIAHYKQTNNKDLLLTDFLKRAPAIATDGKYLYYRNTGESKTYIDFNGQEHTIADKDDSIVVAVVNNIDIKQSIHKDLISKATGKTLSYKHELADAQGFASPEHFRDLIERIYGWESTDQDMYDELMDPKHAITDENIRWLKRSSKSYTPLKMTHFEVADKMHPSDPDGHYGSGLPIYLKYSIAPLFPAMTNGTEMQRIVDQMRAQGIEQIVFKSGSKASNPAPTTIHNINEDNTYGGVKTEMRFNPFIIDASKTKMQVELPTKLDKQSKLGMQAPKNILTNMDLDSADKVYNFRKENKTASEIYDDINDTAVQLLQGQLDGVLKDLGYENIDGKSSFDKLKIKKLLIKQMDLETENDLIHLLQTDLPLEAVPNFAQRAFPVISAFLTKNAGKIYTNGSSVVQVANIGYDRLTSEEASQVFYLNGATKLDPPLPVTDKDGNIVYFDKDGNQSLEKKEGFHMQIKKAKILMPFSSVFAKTGLSYDEFIKMWGKTGSDGKPLIDPDIFKNVLGYRIPNQAMSSNDSFEIVGILPDIAGDQAVVYHEITAKTGSDFDIDKMYIMLPNFKVKTQYTMLEEDAEMYKFLSSKRPELLKNLQSYMTRYKFSTGTQILDLFSENKDAEALIKSNPAYSEGRPVKAILNVADDLIEIFDRDNAEKTVNGVTVEFLDILDDLMAAHDRQITEAKKLYKEINDEAWEFKNKKTFKTFKSMSYINDNSKKGLQNRFIELLNSVIESPASYNDLMSPLDSDIIKDTINEVKYLKSITQEERDAYDNLSKEDKADKVSEYMENNRETGLRQMFPVSLLKARVDVLEAKTLIAIMANNMTDLGESQKVAFGMKFKLGLGNHSSLGRTYMLNEDGNADMKLSKIVSYLMNAAVDAAKDSYIISGNVTSYTANSALLLVRMGMPLNRLFTILMNDEVLKFSRYKNYQKAKLSDFSFDYNQEQLDQWSKTLLMKLSDNQHDIFNVISEKDFLENNPNKKEDILGYWNLIMTAGKEFNDAVIASKSESNSAGKNIAQYVGIKNRIQKAIKGPTSRPLHKWFKDGPTDFNMKFNRDIKSNPNMKLLGAMANNTLFLMDEISKDLFMESAPDVVEAVNHILAGLGQPLETNEDSIKLIYSYLYPYLLTQTNHPLYEIEEQHEKYLLKTFPARLNEYKISLKNKGISNMFLDLLEISTTKDRNLIVFPNYKNFNDQDKLMIKEAFNTMMNDPIIDHELFKNGKNPNNLVDQLIQYAFLTSGFKSTYYAFNDFIPAGYFLNSFHGRDIQEFIDNMNESRLSTINYTEALTLIAKQHSDNFKIVKNIATKFKRDIDKNNIVPDKAISHPATLEKLRLNTKSFAPFFKHKKQLFMLTRVDEENHPIYTTIKTNKHKDFNTYSFHNIDKGLLLGNVEYESELERLTQGVAGITNNNILELNDCKLPS